MDSLVLRLTVFLVTGWLTIRRRLDRLAQNVDELSGRAPPRPAPTEIESLAEGERP